MGYKSSRGFLLLIFLTAFLLRLLANAAFEGLHSGPSFRGFGADAVDYNALAVNLASSGEYSIYLHSPTSIRAPGFPFVLAGVYTLFGINNFLAARIFFCIIGALLCVIVYFLTLELADRATAIVAAALIAIYPNLVYYTIHFASEPLFTLLLALLVLCFIKAIQRQYVLLFALSGLILGAAALTRPQALPLLPFFALVILWHGRKQLRSSIAGATIFIVAVFIPILPWTIRNYQVHDRFVLINAKNGSTFWGSNNDIVLKDPRYRGRWISSYELTSEEQKISTLPNEVDRDRLRWGNGINFLREHPGTIPRLMWYKFREFWTPLCKSTNSSFNLIIGWSYGTLLPFFLLGFLLISRRRHGNRIVVSIITLPIIITILGALVFYGNERLRSPIEPFLLIFASIALTTLFRYICNQIRPRETSHHTFLQQGKTS